MKGRCVLKERRENLRGQDASWRVRHAARRHENGVKCCDMKRKRGPYMKCCGEEGGNPWDGTGPDCMPCACMCIACKYLRMQHT